MKTLLAAMLMAALLVSCSPTVSYETVQQSRRQTEAEFSDCLIERYGEYIFPDSDPDRRMRHGCRREWVPDDRTVCVRVTDKLFGEDRRVVSDGYCQFAGSPNRSTVQLEVGQCLADPLRDLSARYVMTASCDEPHTGQVFSVLAYDRPDQGVFPGVDELEDEGDAHCAEAWSDVGGDRMGGFEYRVLVPLRSRDDWIEQRSFRNVVCVGVRNDRAPFMETWR